LKGCVPLKTFLFISLCSMVLSAVVAACYHVTPAAGQEDAHTHEKAVKEELLEGIDLLYNWEFKKAERIFQDIIRAYPQRPCGYFYSAMVTWSRLASGYWSPETVHEFKERIDRTIEIARKRVEGNEADSYDHLYLGGALGFKGRFELMKGEWFSSFLIATEALDALEACLNMDPRNKDVLLGLGTFDYYTGRLSGVLKFLSYLLFHPGAKDEGLRKLQVAAREAVYSATEAKSMLLHIYLFLEEEFEKALRLAEDLTERYDQNPRYKFFEGVCAIRLGMDSRFRKIVEQFQEKSRNASSLPMACVWKWRSWYLEAVYDLFHGRYPEARRKLQGILRVADPDIDPSMIAWPLLKVGMSIDLEGERAKAKAFYRQVLEMKNGAGAQFLAKKYLKKPPREKDPFLGY